MTEVKDEDFFKGIAQKAVQLESALSNHKRKASEMEEGDVFTGNLLELSQMLKSSIFRMFA